MIILDIKKISNSNNATLKQVQVIIDEQEEISDFRNETKERCLKFFCPRYFLLLRSLHDLNNISC